MAIRLEVTVTDVCCGSQLALSGADEAFGGWEPAGAIWLQPAGEGYQWTGDIPVPSGGTEFKLMWIGMGGEVTWEPLEGNRMWPSTGVGLGAVVKIAFGVARMNIEASRAQIEASAKLCRNLEDRRGSALQRDVDTKGENAYYYAHNRKYEVPEDAKVISGPGLITGGPPLLLEVGSQALEGVSGERIVWLKNYSWSDSGARVKVYVPITEGSLPEEGSDALVEATYGSHSVDLTINVMPRQKLKIDKLHSEIKAEECSVRVEPRKNRITLILTKKREMSWSNLTKSK
jgi:hypothetical protein|eukprot:TRINITY_DN5124_c0_g1_i1.p1 TRINITY_DN5124_c0_g1~~TRINITY_DN5124_c0_g1_i1.p1  ORF type:complete len:288 (+),score=29.61 TRINITY_DN5124_c0_g1_i1:74-937(+)